MIEQTMVFSAGFLLAGLLALLLLPALWRRALRLSRRRLEMRMPLSMDEVVAERDQLRAEFAIDRRRIEQAQEALQHARAEDMAELGRRKAAIAALDDERASLRTQLSAAIAHAGIVQAQAEQAQSQFDVLNQARQLEISALESSVESLRLANSDLEGELAKARAGLEHAKPPLKDLDRERAFALTDLAAASARRDALQGSVEALGAKAEQLEGELRELRVERDALAGALEAARRDSTGFKPVPEEGDDLLRKAIAELGAEMLRVAGPRTSVARSVAKSPVKSPMKSPMKSARDTPKADSASLAPKRAPRQAAAAGE